MALRLPKPYTVLITATGKTSITLTIHPVPVLVGLAAIAAVPTVWIGTLVHHNVRLAQQNQQLSETASEVITDLNAIGAEIEVLKDRAGVSEDATGQDAAVPQAVPQGGVAKAAAPEAILDLAKRRIPGLEAALASSVKPALEETLASEAEQQAAFPSGKPLAGELKVSSEFGLRPNPFGGSAYEMHEGLDFGGPVGKPILATAEGVVVQAEYAGGFGNHVKIDHGYSYETLYAHMSELEVKIGDRVERGDVVGYLGSTGRSSGPHLHYSIYRNGQAINPRYYLRLESAKPDGVQPE
ncbi:MAG: M23 family metallopeptidase [Nodosilinea sp.]